MHWGSTRRRVDRRPGTRSASWRSSCTSSPGARALAAAARELYGRYGSKARPPERLDVVHAHFGLTAWPALAVRARVRGLTVHGTDVRHPRTRLATGAALPLMDLVAAPTAELARELPNAHCARACARAAVRGGHGALSPAPPRGSPRRTGPRSARAPTCCSRPTPRAPASATTARSRSPGQLEVPLHTLGGVAPEQVPLWVNAANAVVVPSDAEGFGLAVLEALACDVPVLATPVGVHPQALEGVEGALCAPFELNRWRAAVEPHLRVADPRVAGRAHAEPFSVARMAERLAQAWRTLLAGHARRSGERGG